MDYVFGYGTLVDLESLKRFLKVVELKAETHHATLFGYSRSWNVAMDNSIDLPNYKYYLDEDSREREDIFVTFLNIIPNSSKSIYGILFPVVESDLKLLDLRERNYTRVDVTDSFKHLSEDDIVYTYIANSDGITRFKEGSLLNSAYVSKDYYDQVASSFKKLGGAIFNDYLNSFVPPSKMKKLIRVDT